MAVGYGSQAVGLKLTTASFRRVQREVKKAGTGAYSMYVYETQEVVIMAPDAEIPLPAWEKSQRVN